jgi:hypothetical protein
MALHTLTDQWLLISEISCLFQVQVNGVALASAKAIQPTAEKGLIIQPFNINRFESKNGSKLFMKLQNNNTGAIVYTEDL